MHTRNAVGAATGRAREGLPILASAALLVAFALACTGGGGSSPPGIAPVVSPFSVQTPASFQQGDLRFDYRLIGPAGDTRNVRIEYSTDGGTNWTRATERSGAPSEGTVALAAGPAPGLAHVFVWNTVADLGAASVAGVRLRVAVQDEAAEPQPIPGTEKATDPFTVNNGPPVLTGVSPRQAVSGRETQITISGVSLFNGTAALQDGACAKTVLVATVLSDTAISATVPATMAETWYRVLVTTPSGTTEVTPCVTDPALLTSAERLDVVPPPPPNPPPPPPVVNAVSPATADNLATLTLTVMGTGFTGATLVELDDGVTVTALTNVTVADDATVTATLTARQAPPGAYGVYVTAPGGRNAASNATFTVTQGLPEIDTVSPAAGPDNANTTIAITGINFTGATGVTLQGTPAAALVNVTVVSDGRITATVLAGQPAGIYDVIVTTPVGSSTPRAASRYTVTTPGGGGGGGGSGSTNDDEPARNPSSANVFPFASRAAAPAAVTELVLEDYGSIVYAFGGDSGGAVSAAIWRYDPLADSWTVVAALGTARAGACAARLGSVIYVLGGHDGAAALASVETYDAATGQVGSVASMSTARNHAAAAIVGNKIYVFGGTPHATLSITSAHASAEVYDAAANTWTAVAGLPGPRWALMGTSVAGTVYLIGGHDATNTGAAAQSAVLAYDPATDAYQPKASAPAPRHGGVALPDAGRIFVCGGTYTIPGWTYTQTGDAQYETSLVEVYDPAADSWSTRQTMLNARTMLGGTMADGFAYLAGGHALDLAGGLEDVGKGGQASAANGPVPLGVRTVTSAVERFDPLTSTGTTAPAGSGGSGGSTAQGHTNLTIQSSGAARQYRLYVPAGFSNQTPHSLVLMLHGTTHDVTKAELDVARFEVQADRDGALLVMPQGVLTVGPANPPIYAPGYPNPIVSISPFGLAPVPGETHVPNYPDVYSGPGVPASTWEMHDWQAAVNLDYQFMLDIIAHVSANYHVDAKRIYQFGQSAGALHTSTVATHHGEVYAACVSIAGGDIVTAYAGSGMSFGGLSGWPAGMGPQGPTPSLVAQAGGRRTPFLFLHGTTDVDVPVAGSTALRTAMLTNGWDENEAQIHQLNNGTHVWFTLNEEIWAFFKAHALP